MANAETKIERVEIVLKDDLTICNLFYTSNEPGTPWGGGWKTKTFGVNTDVVEIMQVYVPAFLMWSNGREGVNEAA